MQNEPRKPVFSLNENFSEQDCHEINKTIGKLYFFSNCLQEITFLVNEIKDESAKTEFKENLLDVEKATKKLWLFAKKNFSIPDYEKQFEENLNNCASQMSMFMPNYLSNGFTNC